MTEIDRAKELIALEEKKKIDECSIILNVAFDKIKELGYTISIMGQFVDNKIETGLQIIKIK